MLKAVLFIIAQAGNNSHAHQKKRMDKQIMVYPCNGKLLPNKKECTVDTSTTWMNLKNFILKSKQKRAQDDFSYYI